MPTPKNITIGIDASRITIKERTGIEEYVYQLAQHLPKHAPKHVQFMYYVQEQPKQKYPNNVTIKHLPKQKFWTQHSLSKELKNNPPDIFFSPVYTLPLLHPKCSIATIHGLEFITSKESYSTWHNLYHKFITTHTLKSATHIITPSQSTKDDLKEYYIPKQPITVVHNGINHTKDQRTPSEHPTIVSIGRLEERKGTYQLLKAFNTYKEETQDKTQLILIGKWGTEGVEKIKEAIEKSPFKKDIIVTGYLSEKEKQQYLKSAHLFAFLSKAEGFGIPMIEAMDLGIPVLSSKDKALQEVGGKAAHYEEATDTAATVKAIKKLLTQKQQESKEKEGKTHAQQFSWSKCAKQTLETLLKSYEQQ